MAGNERDIRLFQLKFRVAQQARDAHLDDPNPELFAAHGGAIQIHQHGFDRFLGRHRVQRIVRRISNRRFHAGQRVVAKGNELHFAVAGFHDVHNTVFAGLEVAVLGRFQRAEAALAVDVTQIRDMNGFGNVHRSRILFFVFVKYRGNYITPAVVMSRISGFFLVENHQTILAVQKEGHF